MIQPQNAHVSGKVLMVLCYAVQTHATLPALLHAEQLLMGHTLVVKAGA